MGAELGAIPANESESILPNVTAGFAKLVEEVKKYAPRIQREMRAGRIDLTFFAYLINVNKRRDKYTVFAYFPACLNKNFLHWLMLVLTRRRNAYHLFVLIIAHQIKVEILINTGLIGADGVAHDG